MHKIPEKYYNYTFRDRANKISFRNVVKLKETMLADIDFSSLIFKENYFFVENEANPSEKLLWLSKN